MSAIAWIGLVAALIAGTQAWIAHRKLRLDLFDKRFQVYEDMNEAINDRYADISRNDRIEKPEIDIDVLKRFWKNQRKMKLLFPHEVAKAVDRIEELLRICDSVHINLRYSNFDKSRSGTDEFATRYDVWLESQKELNKAQNQLAEVVHLYVYQYGWDEALIAFITKNIIKNRNEIDRWIESFKRLLKEISRYLKNSIN